MKAVDADLVSAWFEMTARRVLAGDTDFASQVVFVQPVQTAWTVAEWDKSPGSPDAQMGVQRVRELVQPVLADRMQSGFVLWPVHNREADHWTLLVLQRRQQDAQDSQPFKWEAQYRDSVSPAVKSSLKKAQTGLAILREAIGQTEFAYSQPVQCETAKQSGSHECGWYTICWMEEIVRQARGEGIFRLDTQNLQPIAARLTKWNQAVQTAWKKLTDKDSVAEKPDPVPAKTSVKVSSAVGKPPKPVQDVPLTIVEESQPEYGCSRCKYAKTGCLSCNPVKMAKWADKQVAKDAAESASQAQGSQL